MVGHIHSLFLGSSVVEQLAVNQLVVGSNPTRGAISFLNNQKHQYLAYWCFFVIENPGIQVSAIPGLRNSAELASGDFSFRVFSKSWLSVKAHGNSLLS